MDASRRVMLDLLPLPPLASSTAIPLPCHHLPRNLIRLQHPAVSGTGKPRRARATRLWMTLCVGLCVPLWKTYGQPDLRDSSASRHRDALGFIPTLNITQHADFTYHFEVSHTSTGPTFPDLIF